MKSISFKRFVNLLANQTNRCGANTQRWIFLNKLDSLVDNEYNDIPLKFEKYSEAAITLLEDMLTWDPEKRITVEEAL